jgi:hypothetical protein
MRRYGWISLAVCLTGFEVWAVFVPIGPMNLSNSPILLPLIVAAFTASGIGGWWMILKILRQERHIFPIVLVPLLIPNSFLWYYFEGVGPKKEIRD